MTLIGLWAAGAAIPDEGIVAGLVAGLKVAAVAVVAQAVVVMARRLTPDLPRLVLAAPRPRRCSPCRRHSRRAR